MQQFTIEEETPHGCIVQVRGRRMLIRATAADLKRARDNPEPLGHDELPEATMDQREFLISGLEPEEFDEIASSLSDDDDDRNDDE